MATAEEVPEVLIYLVAWVILVPLLGCLTECIVRTSDAVAQ